MAATASLVCQGRVSHVRGQYIQAAAARALLTFGTLGTLGTRATGSPEATVPRKRSRTPNSADSPRAPGQRNASGRGRSTLPEQERAYLVGLDHQTARDGARGPAMPAEESLRELARLARTVGATVVGQTLQRRRRPDPSSYIGSGKLEAVRAERKRTAYSLVIFDEQLSPAQQSRIESALEVKVLDRSALILDIFASRARTREAALQVELAQHEYLLPRLRGQWQHLERLEGAIGSRGPGETQLETDRRLIGARITRLKRQIEAVRRQRALHRRRRTRAGIPVVALVGYTNAGKSSLMKALAGADALVADAPFATLDPLTRRIPAGEGPSDRSAFLLTDTVGFIQKLPAQLVSAFRATLEELDSADLLLHVIDATSPAAAAQAATVMETLEGLGLAAAPVLTVLNKVDGLARSGGGPVECEADLTALEVASPAGLGDGAVPASALRGWGIEALRRRIAYEVLGEPIAVAAAP